MIDLVYKTVQTIINKDNNGYVSPTEFNLLANNIQEAIFRNYFEDENRDKTKENRGFTNKGYANLDFVERQRIVQFAATVDLTKVSGKFTLPTGLRFIEDDGITILNSEDEETSVIEEVERNVFGYLNRSKSKPTTTYPVYEHVGNTLTVLPTTVSDIRVRYLRDPKMPNWTYVMVGGKELFDPSNNSYQDFELHESEFSNIVLRMLSFFSINLREQEVIEIAERLKGELAAKDNN